MADILQVLTGVHSDEFKKNGVNMVELTNILRGSLEYSDPKANMVIYGSNLIGADVSDDTIACIKSGLMENVDTYELMVYRETPNLRDYFCTSSPFYSRLPQVYEEGFKISYKNDLLFRIGFIKDPSTSGELKPYLISRNEIKDFIDFSIIGEYARGNLYTAKDFVDKLSSLFFGTGSYETIDFKVIKVCFQESNVQSLESVDLRVWPSKFSIYVDVIINNCINHCIAEFDPVLAFGMNHKWITIKLDSPTQKGTVFTF